MALERLALQLGAVALIVLGAWLWHAGQVHDAREAGRAEAVSAGERQRAIDAAAALTTERALRAKLTAADAAAQRTEQTHAENLAAAQRRVRAGTDVLRCPAASPVQSGAAVADGSASGGPAPDGPGETIVPAVAADILGLAADTGRLVRKYERLEARFDECRALNNGIAHSP